MIPSHSKSVVGIKRCVVHKEVISHKWTFSIGESMCDQKTQKYIDSWVTLETQSKSEYDRHFPSSFKNTSSPPYL